MSDIAIKVEGLGKQYRIGRQQARYKTIRETIVDGARAPFRRASRVVRGQGSAADLDETIWALKDVSFEVKQGEVVGVIGRNGAGKTTLLKLLSRITEPTAGDAWIHGRVGSLLEVGTGFHPELTGRENVFLNGAILGMSRNEIDRKFDEIVDFAEIEKFIDTPVKHYSSGMYVRLAFAVAAHMETEILLVDEVLAVGDAAFQNKCLGKMSEVADGGKTVLFVSHNMGVVNRLCNDVIYFQEGKIIGHGPSANVISDYLSSGYSDISEWKQDDTRRIPENEIFNLLRVAVADETRRTKSHFEVSDPVLVEIEFELRERLQFGRIGYWITSVDGTIVFEAYDSDELIYPDGLFPGKYRLTCKIPGRLFKPGQYAITVNSGIPGLKNLVFCERLLTFELEHIKTKSIGVRSHRRGIIHPELDWVIDKFD